MTMLEDSGLAAAAIRSLAPTFGDHLILPGSGSYDKARAVYFTGIDRRPAAIVRPADAVEVARVVVAARESGASFTVRGGGHGLGGQGVTDGGIVLDLARMRSIEIDPVSRTGWAEGGITAGEYTTAAAAHGLATGFGDAPSVGVAGITLAGGVGFLHRKLGLTIDSLLAADIVTADGRLLRADAENHPDLFWAIRGGGGGSGVATRLRFRLHEVDRVVGGMMILPADPEMVVRFLAAFQEAPGDLSGLAALMIAPPMPFIPAEHHGRFVLMATLVHSGSEADAARVLAPFRALATPIVDLIEPTPYTGLYEHEGGPPPPSLIAARSFFLDTLDREGADAIFEHLRAPTTGVGAPMRIVQFRVMGGAVARISSDATAFAHRERGIMAIAAAIHDEVGEAAEHAAWASALVDALAMKGAGAAYAGFLGGDGADEVGGAWSGSTGDRLARVRARYDPDGLFRRSSTGSP